MMRVWKHAKKWLAPVFMTTAVFLLMRFVILFGYVPTESMEPTLGRGSYLLGTRIYFSLDEGDVIIFHSGGRLLVKRIAAVPGDTIDLDALIYMASMERPYREDSILVVPEDCYFVLGDNTQNSYDSRYWEDPLVREEDIVAKLLWP